MALLEDLVCTECSKPFRGVRTRNYGSLCDECAESLAKKEKDSWLKEWRGDNDLEARIAKIEEWIFEHQDLVEEARWDGPIR